MTRYAPASDIYGMARQRGNGPAESRRCQARGMRVEDMVVVGCSRLQERIRACPQQPAGQTSPGSRVKKKRSSSWEYEGEMD
jgi:hypothetical protein